LGNDWSQIGIGDWLTAERILDFLQALIILAVGLPLSRLAGVAVARLATRRTGRQEVMVLRRLVYYPLAALVLLSAMNQLGFQLGVLLGAAGILTVAIGFASQTSASNLISGLFLIMERPFVIGDIITVAGATGEVLSIDLLSVKLRTFDNLFVRVPNEEIIKTKVTNLTHFPIRRIDLQLSLAYKEDLDRVRRLLAETADRNPLCLREPPPLYIFKSFSDGTLQIQFCVWTARDDYLALSNSIQQEIKAAFETAGVEVPSPRAYYGTGSELGPASPPPSLGRDAQ
jgi:small-conductance mechanosensitive channel